MRSSHLCEHRINDDPNRPRVDRVVVPDTSSVEDDLESKSADWRQSGPSDPTVDGRDSPQVQLFQTDGKVMVRYTNVDDNEAPLREGTYGTEASRPST
jgi:hypothetical protein